MGSEIMVSTASGISTSSTFPGTTTILSDILFCATRVFKKKNSFVKDKNPTNNKIVLSEGCTIMHALLFFLRANYLWKSSLPRINHCWPDSSPDNAWPYCWLRWRKLFWLQPAQQRTKGSLILHQHLTQPGEIYVHLPYYILVRVHKYLSS